MSGRTVVEVPISWYGSTKRPRQRKWGHSWLTETVAFPIEVLDPSETTLAARFRHSEGDWHSILHDGRDFLRHLRAPTRKGEPMTLDAFRETVAGRGGATSHSFLDFAFPKPRPANPKDPVPADDSFRWPRRPGDEFAEETDPNDKAKDAAMRRAVAAAARMRILDGVLYLATPEPMLRLTHFPAEPHEDLPNPALAYGRPKLDDDDFLYALPDVADDRFADWVPELAHLRERVECHAPALFRRDAARENAATIGRHVLRAAEKANRSWPFSVDPAALLRLAGTIALGADLMRLAKDGLGDRHDLFERAFSHCEGDGNMSFGPKAAARYVLLSGQAERNPREDLLDDQDAIASMAP